MLKILSNSDDIESSFYYSKDVIKRALENGDPVVTISGDINEHVKITKDKFGEITLNLQMLIEVLTINRMYILATNPNNCIKFYTYIVARAFKILLLTKAIDEDYLIEFREDLENLGNLFLSYEHLMKHAIYNGLDVNWLLDAEIPENIVAIHKEIRANGFLK